MEKTPKPSKNRGLANRRAFSNAIDAKLFDDFTKLAAETKIPKSKLLDEAIELLIKKYQDG